MLKPFLLLGPAREPVLARPQELLPARVQGQALARERLLARAREQVPAQVLELLLPQAPLQARGRGLVLESVPGPWLLPLRDRSQRPVQAQRRLRPGEIAGCRNPGSI